MIEYIKGEIAELTPAMAVVETNGIGYAINISLNTYSAIQNLSTCKLYIFEAIREDAHILYGFFEKKERELFLLLISVSGIGGNTARTMLSALSVSELCQVISAENAKLLTMVKGIGLKTAQRVIVELKDKVKVMGTVSESTTKTNNSGLQDEAIAALTMLGFNGAASQKVVFSILQEEPTISVEQLIKLALKRL